MKQEDIYVPSGMLTYQCSQSGECCGGWEIGLDKKSHDRLKFVLGRNNQKRLFKENVKKVDPKDSKSNHGYYSVIQFTDGKCGMLEPNGLCGLHKNHGIEILPDICKAFPRLIYKTPFGKELSITFSCPSAAKLLKNKEKIVMVKNPDNFFFAHGDLYYCYITHEIFDRKDIVQFYYHLEHHFIEILQSRSLTTEERLVLLGITVKRLESFDQPTMDQVNDAIQLNRNIIQQSFFKEDIKQIHSNIDHQVFLLKEFVNLRIPSLPNEELEELFRYIAKTFKFDQDDDKLHESVELYIQYYRDYYHEVEEIDHVLENYLVFFILRKTFIKYTLREAYFLTIFFYSLIRLTAIGLAKRNKQQVDEDLMIKAVWVIEKAIGHSILFYQGIIDFLREKNLTTVSHAITLLKTPEKKPVVST
ncbi:MAG: hypothetical protein IEMM0008_0827 [bacterium]|nr:MAG: hypothetical protein IEMM0008_0827 [bacterium]